MNSTNLLRETLLTLECNHKSSNDVVWVGSIDGKLAVSWSEFERIADIEYNASFGGTEIVTDLVVVGKDWWLERHEYDGSEWWEYKRKPICLRGHKAFTKVKGDGPLLEVNESDGQEV